MQLLPSLEFRAVRSLVEMTLALYWISDQIKGLLKVVVGILSKKVTTSQQLTPLKRRRRAIEILLVTKSVETFPHCL